MYIRFDASRCDLVCDAINRDLETIPALSEEYNLKLNSTKQNLMFFICQQK